MAPASSPQFANADILKWRDLVGQPFEQARWPLHLVDSPERETAAYGHLQGLRLVRAVGHPAVVYLDAQDRVVLILASGPGLSGVVVDELRQSLGPGASLASRQRGSTHEVHASDGIAFSVSRSDQALDFVEVFAPRSDEQYRQELYMPPEKHNE